MTIRRSCKVSMSLTSPLIGIPSMAPVPSSFSSCSIGKRFCGAMNFTGSSDISPKALPLIRAMWSLVGKSANFGLLREMAKQRASLERAKMRQLFVGARTQQDFNAINAELAGMDINLMT